MTGRSTLVILSFAAGAVSVVLLHTLLFPPTITVGHLRPSFAFPEEANGTPPLLHSSWNRPEKFQWHTWEDYQAGPKRSGKPELGKQQKLFSADHEARIQHIGPTVRRMARSNNNTIVTAVVNLGQLPLFLNFACSCEKSGIPFRKFTFVFCLDDGAARALKVLGVAHHRVETHNHGDISTPAKVFGDPVFSAIMFYKSAMVYELLSTFSINVLSMDVDMVWRHNPLSYFYEPERQSTDIFLSYDGGNNHWQPIYGNTGFVFTRPTNRSKLFWQEVYLNAHYSNSQQKITSPLLTHHYILNDLRIEILPNQFVNGHLFIKQALDKKFMAGLPHELTAMPNVPPDWLVAHASWTGNLTYKVEKLLAINQWHLASQSPTELSELGQHAAGNATSGAQVFQLKCVNLPPYHPPGWGETNRTSS